MLLVEQGLFPSSIPLLSLQEEEEQLKLRYLGRARVLSVAPFQEPRFG